MKTVQELEAEIYFLKQYIDHLHNMGKYFTYENGEIRPMSEEERDYITNRKCYKVWEIEAKTYFGHQLNDIDRYKYTLPTFHWCMMESLKRMPIARNANGIRAIEKANGYDVISRRFLCEGSDDLKERVESGKMR